MHQKKESLLNHFNLLLAFDESNLSKDDSAKLLSSLKSHLALIQCFLLSNNKEIKNLNNKFRKKNKTTDVLSFPFQSKQYLKRHLKGKKEIYLGDIIINLNKIKSKKNISEFKFEFDKLWVHGLIHLFGYDHKKKKDFLEMSLIEKKYMNLIND